MTVEENKDIVRRMANIINSGDLSSLDELLHEDVIYRSSAGEETRGIEEFKELIRVYQEAFTDLEVSPGEMVGEGNTVFGFYRQQGTHTGELLGIEPSNNEMNLMVSSKLVFENGKLVEEVDIFDSLDFMRQLGALPEEVITKLEGLGAR